MPPRSITGSMASTPWHLLREAGRDSFVGVAGGDLWRIFTDGSEPTNLTQSFAPRVLEVTVPRHGAEAEPSPSVVVASGENDMMRLRYPGYGDHTLVDLSTGTFTALAKPHEEATLAAYSLRTGVAVHQADTRDGTYVWLLPPALCRQNKRARFVRYWGEGHGIEGAANVLHMWGEIFAWFDHYLESTGAEEEDRGS
ncbi:MAG: hypothetical protein AB1486_30605 [Planctomycetota bacterium]